MSGLEGKIYLLILSFFQTRGNVPCELTEKLRGLISELEELDKMEFILDQQKLWVEQSIRSITEDCSKYPFYARMDTLHLHIYTPVLALVGGWSFLVTRSHLAKLQKFLSL